MAVAARLARRREPVVLPLVPVHEPLTPPVAVLGPTGSGCAGEDDVLDTPRPRGGRVRIALVAFLIALCATLPWALPQLPTLLARAVPDPTVQSVPTDPPIDPPTPLSSVPPTPGPSLVGTRLAAAGRPLEVSVPRLHVRSDVVAISGQSGELLPPSDPQLLGWWQEGRAAGAGEGSAVVTGHTVSVGGGAFDHLGELVPGDRLRVRTRAGSIRYVVREVRDVPVAKLARTAPEIFRLDGPGRLVLITCSDFDGRVYRSNSVVYAEPVGDDPTRRVRTPAPG